MTVEKCAIEKESKHAESKNSMERVNQFWVDW